MEPTTLKNCNTIETLLLCYYSPESFPESISDATRNSIGKLLELSAIEPHEEIKNKYFTTRLGRAWVRLLFETPCPTVILMDSHGNHIA